MACRRYYPYFVKYETFNGKSFGQIFHTKLEARNFGNELWKDNQVKHIEISFHNHYKNIHKKVAEATKKEN